MNYYVYVYLDPRKKCKLSYNSLSFLYEPFYVGYGKNNRLNEHLMPSRLATDSNKLKTNKINKILKENFVPIVIKVNENLSDNEAKKNEKILIAEIGRINDGSGPLTNLTTGGDGGDTYTNNPNREVFINKMKLSLSKVMKTEAYRKKLSEANKGDKNGRYISVDSKIQESIVKDYLNNDRIANLSIKYGFTTEKIKRLLKANNVYDISRKGKKCSTYFELPFEIKQEIDTQISLGCSIRKITRIINERYPVSYNKIKNYLKFGW